jgi:uncharacterized OB-fold protein
MMSDANQAMPNRLWATGPAGEPRLRGGYSQTSGKHHFPKGPVCPYSGAEDVEEVLLPTTGALENWTVVNAAPPGYAGPVPYGFGVVHLDGMDLRLLTRLAITDPAAARAGDAMRLTVEELPADEGTIPLWCFAPQEASQ